MKQLSVPFVADKVYEDTIKDISIRLDEFEQEALNFVPWKMYPYKPSVSFTMAYTSNAILLKYIVTENYIHAANGNINSNVHQDACVEFFVAFDNEGYYNFEFNCIGTNLSGFGKSREQRECLSENIIKLIKFQSTINNLQNEDKLHWELTVAIPFEVFSFHSIETLKGKSCKANFYKCGDLLKEPHFVTWSSIESQEPNFHLPQFFGQLIFN